MAKKLTQYDQILLFFSTTGYKDKQGNKMEYTPTDIYKVFPKFSQSAIRRILKQELVKRDNKLIQESYGHYNFNDTEEPPTIYRKILKIGASCGKKFRKIYAVTYEFNDENREAVLLSAIEEKYPNCIAINYNYRDLTDYKGKFVAKGDDIEDYGYAYEKWTDSVRINQFFPNIKTDEE